MDNLLFQQKIRNIHRQNRVLWISVLAGMIMLILVTLILRWNGSIGETALNIRPEMENTLFLVTVALLFLSFYLKRHYLVPQKMIERASKKEINITSVEMIDILDSFGNETKMVVKVLILMRRYFMLVWSVANILLLFGFISFLLAGQFQTFLIYALIGLYSLTINFPAFSFIEKCLGLMDITLKNSQ